jgi:23S rRNA C2498 (ribose-2'-O)-methylase RlmM
MSTDIKTTKIVESLMPDIQTLNNSEFVRKVMDTYTVIGLKNTGLTAEEKRELKKVAGETIAALDPKDGLQLMLAAQMSAVHDLQQLMAFHATHQSSVEGISYCVNAVTKLSNVFIQQVHALSKLQGKNQQKVRVEHVTIESGAQAVVGSVIHDNRSKDRE